MCREARAALLTLSVLAAIAVSYGLMVAKTVRSSKTCPHDRELRSYEQWLQSVTFPYVAPEAKLRRVKDNYNQVEVGSSKEDVIKAFGPPDFEREMYPKSPIPNWCGYAFRYYFEKPAELGNETRDKDITVFFTGEGKVMWVVGNVGLTEKGGPAHRP